MNLALGIVALLMPPIVGALAAKALWPRNQVDDAGPWFLIFIGWPLGWGLTAAIFFACSLGFARPVFPSAAIELIILVALIGLLASRRRAAADRIPTTVSLSNRLHSSPVLLTIVAQLAVAALVVSIRAAEVEPYGSWDGWAIWNFHARFIDRAHTAWPALLQSPEVAWSHPDYPLLVPASVARLWSWIGSEAPGGAAAVSLLFGVGTAGLLVTGLRRRRGPIVALLAGIVLLSTPFFVTFASNEHADIPLGLFILAVCVLLAESNSSVGDAGQGVALLAGALIGLAAFVKNEGELFAVIATAAWIYLRRRDAALRQSILPFALGLLLAVAPLLYFKLRLAPPNDLAASHPCGRLGQLFEPARHRLILAALWRDVRGFGEWKWLPFIPLALALIGTGWRRLSRGDWSVSAVLLLTFLGYYVVYLLSPFDLQWHLDSSLVRLLMQLWPSALFFWGLAAAKDPGVQPARWGLSGVGWVKTEGRAPPPSLLISVNAGLTLIVLLMFNRQLAPNELAATRFHAVHVVPAADWYPAEASGKSRWSWSSGQSTLHLVAARGHMVTLHFAARGLESQTVTVRRDGQIVWSGAITAHLARFSLPALSAPSDLVFSSNRPGVPESTDARSRTLAFALYDVGIE